MEPTSTSRHRGLSHLSKPPGTTTKNPAALRGPNGHDVEYSTAMLHREQPVNGARDVTAGADRAASHAPASVAQLTRPAPVRESRSAQARSEWERSFRAQVLLTDVLVIVVAVMTAQFLRYGSSPASSGYVGYYETAYSALVAVLWLIALAAFRTRSLPSIDVGLEETRRIVTASLATFGAIAMAELLLKLEFSRTYLAFALPVGVIGLLLSRSLWRGYVSRKRLDGAYRTEVLAVGNKEAVTNLVSELMDNPRNGHHVLGVCLTDHDAQLGGHLTVNERRIPVLGGVGETVSAVASCGADTVAIAGTADFGAKGLRRLIWELEPMDVELLVSPGVMDVALHRLVMRPISGLSLVQVDKPLYQGAKRFQKRAFDICFALAALVAVSPILLVTAIAIKLTSKGPVLYRSERIGIDGKPFTILKFRTMVQDADKQMAHLLSESEAKSPIFFKIHNDPRITPVGQFLRRYSIDELPQFINVLRQDMSVVGPRPQVQREVDAYEADVQRRLLVKPGITGLWQVSGRSDLPLEKAVRLDLSYVDNWSMVGDIVIIAKTVKAVFAREGAY